MARDFGLCPTLGRKMLGSPAFHNFHFMAPALSRRQGTSAESHPGKHDVSVVV